MLGRTMSFEQKRKIANDFINRIDPYKKNEGLKFDMRGYAEYLESNGISGKDVPSHVMEMFVKH